MTLFERYEQAVLRWTEAGTPWNLLRMNFWFNMYRIFTPTPALGFVIGSLVTAGLMWLAAPIIPHRPLIVALLIAAEIGVLAWIWQLVYDRYWERSR
jgi:hypothetical protein